MYVLNFLNPSFLFPPSRVYLAVTDQRCVKYSSRFSLKILEDILLPFYPQFHPLGRNKMAETTLRSVSSYTRMVTIAWSNENAIHRSFSYEMSDKMTFGFTVSRVSRVIIPKDLKHALRMSRKMVDNTFRRAVSCPRTNGTSRYASDVAEKSQLCSAVVAENGGQAALSRCFLPSRMARIPRKTTKCPLCATFLIKSTNYRKPDGNFGRPREQMEFPSNEYHRSLWQKKRMNTRNCITPGKSVLVIVKRC